MAVFKSPRSTINACYLGYVTQAVVNNFLPLLFVMFTSGYGITAGMLGALVAVNFVTQLSVDFIAGKISDKIGYRKMVVAAHIFAVVGLVLLGTLPRVMPVYAGLMISVIISAIGGGIVEVLISPITEACPGGESKRNMSFLHSFYCWGVVATILISTLFFRLAGMDKWYLMCYFWAIIPAVGAVAFMLVPIWHPVEGGKSMSFTDLFKTRIFWLGALLMMCAAAAELSIGQWASAFAELSLVNVMGEAAAKTAGDLLGPCLFAVMMGISRLAFSFIVKKIKVKTGILIGAVILLGAYLLTVFAPHPFVGLAGIALCGLSVGLMWPGLLSYFSGKVPAGGTSLFALLALAGDLGCSLGPALVGAVTDLAGGAIKWGILAAAIFPIIIIAALLINKNKKKAAASRPQAEEESQP